jgi:hypothetical protein
LAVALICLNERKLARTYYVLSEAQDKVVPKINVNHVDWHNNYRLVHCVGVTNTDKPVMDERFCISID